MFTKKISVFLYYLTYAKQYSSRTRITWDYSTSYLMTATRLCKHNFVVSASMRSDTCQNSIVFLAVKLMATHPLNCNVSLTLTHPLKQKMRYRGSLCNVFYAFSIHLSAAEEICDSASWRTDHKYKGFYQSDSLSILCVCGACIRDRNLEKETLEICKQWRVIDTLGYNER